MRCAELHERVRLIQCEKLALTHLADQRLSREGRRPDECAQRCFGGLPPFDDVGGEVFGITPDVETADGRPRLVERGQGGPLLRCGHGGGTYLTMRSNPASALPRMKLSASRVGMVTPVSE